MDCFALACFGKDCFKKTFKINISFMKVIFSNKRQVKILIGSEETLKTFRVEAPYKGRTVYIAQKDVNFSQNIFERFELFAPHAIEARVSKAKFDLKGNL